MKAAGDAAAGNVAGGKMSGSDALFILSELEGKFSNRAAQLARWSEGCDPDCGSCGCGEALEQVRPGKTQCAVCG